MDLEQQITNGEAAYIVGLIHDPQECILTINFARAREPYAVFGTLLFSAVSNYRFELGSEDDRQDFEVGLLMEDLLGIHKLGIDTNPSYCIYTDVREICFNTTVAPAWALTQ